METLRELFFTNGFMPHGFCYLWNPEVIWLHVVSDSLIAISYTVIPIALLWLVRKRQDIPFNWMFLCFGLFIVACGATHVMEVWTLWVPSYWLSGGVKAVTALASVPTAVLLIQLLPKALALPHPEELRRANVALEQQAIALQEQAVRLRQSEADYRSLFEGAPYGILRVALDGTVLMANPALAQMLGLDSEAELIGQILPAEFLGAAHGKEQAGNVRREAHEETEIAWRRRDGRKVLLRAKAQPLPQYLQSPACVEVIVEDISEKRLLEEELRQAQKMETVGQLAGGIAHDFNNILVGILGYGDLLVRDLVPGTKASEHSSEIVRAAVRARELTAQLLAFGRKQPLRPRILSLNHLIIQMTDMLERTLGEDIRLIQDLAPSLTPVQIDPVQFEQVILNLAVNARDAMPTGGTLTIKTANEDKTGQAGQLFSKRCTVLSIKDTGAGINPDALPHIFEPFFTTKSPGRGTGLGLAMVYSSVKQSGGFIQVATDVGRGTTFSVYLPCATEQRQQPRQVFQRVPRVTTPGSETILLVEDDEIVRTLTSDVLESEGYVVFRARSASEGIDRFHRSPQRINLLITDVVMPDMNGLDLARELRQLDSSLKVLYMSGYLSERILPQMKLNRESLFLAKPFLPQDFVGKVREVLDASQRPEAPGSHGSAQAS